VTSPESGTATPLFSVVVPVRDGGTPFETCLAALRSSTFQDRELIVVDDGSADDSAAIAEAAGATVLRTSGGLGPAAARNLGAERARGRYLFFTDADCEVHPDTLELAAARLHREPGLAVLFGSYDDDPDVHGLVGRFRNLLHHWVHQNASPDASSFWSGCGVIRRTLFLEVGGFDASCFPRPSVEDIELGYRLRERGEPIRLAAEIQVRHHKDWGLVEMIRTDFRDRGLPWAALILRRGGQRRELNLGVAGRASVVLTFVLILSLALSVLEPTWIAAAVASAAGIVVVNRRFYGFLHRRGGLRLALGGFLLHLVHLTCAGSAYATARLLRAVGRHS